jgi:hypothetical protein
MNNLRDTIFLIVLAIVMTIPWAYGAIHASAFQPAEGITAINLPAKC